MRMLTALILCVTVAGLSASDAPDISHQDLVAAIQAKSVVLIDCNGSESYAKAHIPGAIDFQASKDQLSSLLPEDKNTLIVAYCGGPKCGAWKKGAQAAADLGYTNVKHYSAGISGWKASQEGQAKAGSNCAGCPLAAALAAAETKATDCAAGSCAVGVAKAEQPAAATEPATVADATEAAAGEKVAGSGCTKCKSCSKVN